MKIAILLNEPYPYGMACTNRIHLYAKGLVELGNDVEILVPRFTEDLGKAINHEIEGEFEGVKFKYACNPIRSKSFIGRRKQDYSSLFNSFMFFIHFKPEIVLVVANNLKYIILAKICSFFIKAKIVREKSEVPYYKVQKISGFRKIKTILEFKLFDGLIVISGELKDFFLKDLFLKMNILEVPILINCCDETLDKNDFRIIKPNLVYTGSLRNDKDGVLILIKAFFKILPNHPNVRLILTGDLESSADKEKILALIDKLDIKGKVEFAGYVSKTELIEITSTASALLLAKPENRQNRYNMATKIGEYLVTGRPILVSAVDPACRYLSHRVNAFIVEPDEDQIAMEIEFILANSKICDDIGLSGKQIAIKFFNYKIHAVRINEFFNELS